MISHVSTDVNPFKQQTDQISATKQTNLSKIGIGQLPKLYQKILWLYYQDRLAGIEKSNRSLAELSKRFDRTPNHISKCLCALEEWNFLGGDPHGSANKFRWITFEAFSELENQNPNQMHNQILSTPYIDLKDQDHEIISEIEEEQNCGKVTPEAVRPYNDETLEEALRNFFRYTNLDLMDRKSIINAFKSSPISVYEQIEIFERVRYLYKKNKIRSIRAYLFASLKKAEDVMKAMCGNNAFYSNNWIYG